MEQKLDEKMEMDQNSRWEIRKRIARKRRENISDDQKSISAELLRMIWTLDDLNRNDFKLKRDELT